MAWTIPATVVSGTQIAAATTNAILADLTIIGGAWTAYTPTTTNITLGNGTVTGRFNQVGKTVDFQCVFTFGSTSSILGSPTFTLPATAQSVNWQAGDSTIFDTSAANFYPMAAIADTTGRVLCRVLPATAGINYAAISSTVPMTWATGDVLTVQGRYEAA